MLSWLFDRWGKSGALTSHELAVVRAFLPHGNPYAESLYSQALHAPAIERKLVGSDGYEAIIPYIYDSSLLIECDRNIDSPDLHVREKSGRMLVFSTTILRGGFLRGLKGRSLDGAHWSKEWVPDSLDLVLPIESREWLPPPLPEADRDRTIELLLAWCGLERNQVGFQILDHLLVREPASEQQLAACERRLGVKLSGQYRQLLAISNGLTFDRREPTDLLGTEDVELLGDLREWLGLVPGVLGNSFVALRIDDGTMGDVCHLLETVDAGRSLCDLRHYVRYSLVAEPPIL